MVSACKEVGVTIGSAWVRFEPERSWSVMGRARMTTPRTCCALEHRFQALSIKEGCCFHDDDETHKQKHKQIQNPLPISPVELKSQGALPPQWEQFLDMKTGELYYYDWRSGRKTENDPRQLLRVSQKVSVLGKEAPAERPECEFVLEDPLTSEVEDNNSDLEFMDDEQEEFEDSEESRKEVGEGHGALWGTEGAREGGNGCSSSRSSHEDLSVLVAAGCQSCLMYYMLPKHVLQCPKCGTAVLHFNEPATAATGKGKEIQESNVG